MTTAFEKIQSTPDGPHSSSGDSRVTTGPLLSWQPLELGFSHKQPWEFRSTSWGFGLCLSGSAVLPGFVLLVLPVTELGCWCSGELQDSHKKKKTKETSGTGAKQEG